MGMMEKTRTHRNETQPLNSQRGFLLITAVVLIVVVALLLTVMLFLGATGNESSVGHSQSKQALFIAETGMEHSLHDFKNGTACASLSYSNISIGQGSFTVTGTLYNPASTTLSSNINTTDTYIPAASVAGYATHGRITIGSEAINYTGTSASSCGAFTPPCFTGATRGVAGTTAAAHTSGASVSQNQCVIQSVGTVNSTKRMVERATSSTSSSAGAMMVYAKANGNGIPYYRRWDGTAWGAEATATSVGADINWLVLKYARTRNEAILVSQSSTGQIRAQIWNGTSWSATTLLATVAGGNAPYRGFDVEYETSGDRAVVAYNNNVNSQVSSRIWDGTGWLAATNWVTALSQPPRWIELAPNPLAASNDIAMIMLDSQSDVHGLVWNGVTWSNMGAGAAWETSAASSIRQVIDVAYEQLSGRAMFIWGDNNAGEQRYRTWNGSALSVTSLLDLGSISGPDMNEVARWLRLAPRTGSNQLMYGVQDVNSDLFSAFWDGTGWSGGIRHDGSTEDGDHRNFDLVFETWPGNEANCWLVWGDGGGISRRQWTGSGWGGITSPAGDDDTALVQLLAHPGSGAVLAAIYEDLNASSPEQIFEMHLTSGSATWTAFPSIWSGPTVTDPVKERITLAAERSGLTLYDWLEIFP